MSMTNHNVWTYHQELDNTRDLVGFDVEATDGHIGKVDDETSEVSRNYLVVDTGFWIFGKKRLIPAGVIERVDRNDQRIFVRMTKDAIKDAPDYEEMKEYTENDYDQFGQYYERYNW